MNKFIDFLLIGLPIIGISMLVAYSITGINILIAGGIFVVLPIMLVTFAILRHKEDEKNDN